MFDLESITKSNKRPRIFISYSHDGDLDVALARDISQVLSQKYSIFIDRIMPIGERWAERIEKELRESDFLVTLLSESSVHSEMVRGEIETADRLAKEGSGRPVILPVRVAYREPFQYPLSAYINPINWVFWENANDTARLIEELIRAISGGALSLSDEQAKSKVIVVSNPPDIQQPLPSAQPLQVEMPEGTMDPESRFYVQRQSDQIALAAIKKKGVTITIKGPRQMGKSSLLIRSIAAALEQGKRTVFLDFQLINKTALTDADLFFKQFCSWISIELGMEDRVEEFWKLPLGNNHRCTKYMQRYLLPELGTPLVLAMDEVDSIFGASFRSDFFGMLRSWHNMRPVIPIWKQLDLVLVTSTEPYQLIENLNQSPFNVGEVIELEDFIAKQVADLNNQHGLPLNFQETEQLMSLLGGHPYLIRKALYLITTQRMSLEHLLNHATDDRGPFGDHLRYHWFRLHDRPELIEGLKQVIRNNSCQDGLVFFRLRGAGLVRVDKRGVVPRCQLYDTYFREHLYV